MVKRLINFLFILFFIFPNNYCSSDTFKQKSWPIESKIAAGWFGTCIADVACALSKPIRHFIFGNQSIPLNKNNYIASLLKKMPQLPSLSLKQANAFWGFFGDKIFSVHDTLFMSKELVQQLKYSTLTVAEKRDITHLIARSIAMISTKRDQKIVMAALLVPLLIHFGYKSLHFILQKIALTKTDNALLGKLNSLVEKCSDSFRFKAIASLLAMISAIRYLDNRVAMKTIEILGEFGESRNCQKSAWSLTNPLGRLVN